MDAILVHDVSHLNGALQKLNERVRNSFQERIVAFVKEWIEAFSHSSENDKASSLIPFMSLDLTIERDQMTL